MMTVDGRSGLGSRELKCPCPQRRIATRTRLALALVAILCGLVGASGEREVRPGQRVPGVPATKPAASYMFGSRSSQVSTSNSSGGQGGRSDSKNVNHSSQRSVDTPRGSAGTDCRPDQRRDNAPNARSIDHLATARRRVDKSTGDDDDGAGRATAAAAPLNHLRRAAGGRRKRSGALSPPKLVQWSKEAVQYHEGSTLVLSCSLSYAGGEQAPLKFAWFKQGKPLLPSGGGGGASQVRAAGDVPPASAKSPNGRLSIETLADYSFLRLIDLRPGDSGAYACVVSNSLGQEDRTTTQVIVNVKLKWLPASENEAATSGADTATNKSSVVGNGHQLERARAGQSVSFECNAAGGGGGHLRAPRVRWYRLALGQSQVPASGPGDAHRFLGRQQTGLAAPSSDRPLDEAQLRSSLLQLDSTAALTESPYRRLELVNTAGDNELLIMDKQYGGELLAASNGSSIAGGAYHSTHTRKHSQLRHPVRWRIETNSGPGLGAMSSQQQHEVYSRLVLERLDQGASGLYECEVVSSPQTQQSMLEGVAANGAGASGDKLRRVFGLLVNGK